MMKLVVNDSYIGNMGKFLKDSYALLDTYVGEYISILGTIVEEGIDSGKTHDALIEFQNQVSTKSGEKNSFAKRNGEILSKSCDDFISKLDKADGDLY